eukprot:m.8231 g.8231  ORF g.8231 m.8231 type:complete len:816 (-) comp5337_c0_seq1:457-2904(-)
MATMPEIDITPTHSHPKKRGQGVVQARSFDHDPLDTHIDQLRKVLGRGRSHSGSSRSSVGVPRQRSGASSVPTATPLPRKSASHLRHVPAPHSAARRRPQRAWSASKQAPDDLSPQLPPKLKPISPLLKSRSMSDSSVLSPFAQHVSVAPPLSPIISRYQDRPGAGEKERGARMALPSAAHSTSGRRRNTWAGGRPSLRASFPLSKQESIRPKAASTYLPDIPGLKRQWRQPEPQAAQDYMSYASIKPLHDRGIYSMCMKRQPAERIIRAVKRDPSGVKVIRVGGGYIILSAEWEAFFSHGALRDSLSAEDFVPPGVKVLKRLEDGTLILEDGTRILADGTRVFADGSRLTADGRWLDADGNEITDPDKIAELNAAHADAVAASRPGTQMGRRLSRRNSVRRSSRGSRSSFDGNCSDTDGGGDGRDSPATFKTAEELRQEQLLREKEAKMKERARKQQLLQDITWEFDQEVVEILADGTRVLADGTRIRPDGSVVLADGTVLSKEEALELAKKRKLGKWPKALSKDEKKGKRGGAGDGSDSEDEYGQGGGREGKDAPYGLDRFGRALGADGRPLDPDAPYSDDEYELDEFGNRRRRRFPRGDPYGFGAGDDPITGYFPPSHRVNALDYLAKYCILTKEQLRLYRQVFDNLDRDGDGLINHVELEFGIKTVNKDFISSQESNYVNVVLEVKRATAINFRMFAVISALSERVVNLDSLVRGLINTMDATGLASKLIRCKDLFYILAEKQKGIVSVDDLHNELVAGRISEEHEQIIIDKFTENGQQEIDFLDFLTYIPLFVEIHDTINNNPFETVRDR